MLILLNCIKSDWKLWSSRQGAGILSSYAETGRKLTLITMGKYNKLHGEKWIAKCETIIFFII